MQKSFEKEFDLNENETWGGGDTHFHMSGFDREQKVTSVRNGLW